jgi:hypothetical protein
MPYIASVSDALDNRRGLDLKVPKKFGPNQSVRLRGRLAMEWMEQVLDNDAQQLIRR